MSIEALLQAHIVALAANTAAVNLLTESLYGRALPKTEEPVAKAEKVIKAKAEPKVEPKEEPKEEPTKLEDDVEKAEDETAPGVAFGTVREMVIKLSSAHRDAIKSINAKHGIARLSALLKDENDFASVIDQPKLEAIYSDLQELEVV